MADRQELHAADLRGMRCPACKRGLAGKPVATEEQRKAIGERKPQKGDCTSCLYCLALLVFDGNGGVRLMTMTEINSMTPEERLFVETMARRFAATQL